MPVAGALNFIFWSFEGGFGAFGNFLAAALREWTGPRKLKLH
jgi:hypothetical protein